MTSTGHFYYHSTGKGLELRGMADSRVSVGIYKMNLKHGARKEGCAQKQKDGGMSKGDSQSQKAPSGQPWNNLSHKINSTYLIIP